MLWDGLDHVSPPSLSVQPLPKPPTDQIVTFCHSWAERRFRALDFWLCLLVFKLFTLSFLSLSHTFCAENAGDGDALVRLCDVVSFSLQAFFALIHS